MEEIKKELNSATEYLRAMKKSGHHKGDCDNILMHLANIEDLVNKLFIADVVGRSEQLKAFVDWWHGLSQEELAWYEGRYVEVFLSL